MRTYDRSAIHDSTARCRHCESAFHQVRIALQEHIHPLWPLGGIALLLAVCFVPSPVPHPATMLDNALIVLALNGIAAFGVFLGAAIIGSPLFLFMDALGNVHAEGALPVLGSPGRGPQSLPLGPVLRIGSGLFRDSGLVVLDQHGRLLTVGEPGVDVRARIEDDALLLDLRTTSLTLRGLSADDVLALAATQRTLDLDATTALSHFLPASTVQARA